MEIGVVRWAAIVVNPAKLDDGGKFCEAVSQAMREHGWGAPFWLETTAEEPGQRQAREAVEAVRVPRAGLRRRRDGDRRRGRDRRERRAAGHHSGGTGNLLARNVGLPADRFDALEVALTGVDQPIDAGVANGKPFVAMAGIGLDADAERHERGGEEALRVRRLRRVRAASSARPADPGHLTADGGPPVRLRTSGIIVGNVGWLRAGLPLLPDAAPDDGVLDAAVLSARGIGSWLAVAVHLVLRRAAAGRVTKVVFRELTVEAAVEQPWEIDGEVMGATRRLVVTAEPGRLR